MRCASDVVSVPLLARTMRVGQWMRSHSSEEIREKMPTSLRIEDAAIELEGVRSLKNMLSEDGKFTSDGPVLVQKVLATSMESVRNAKIDLTKTYTNEFVALQ